MSADLLATYEAARARSEAVTPGGLHGDPATLSGVQRGNSDRAMARRFAAYDREAAAARALSAAEQEAERKAAAAARAAVDAEAHRDLASLTRGDHVRTRHGWSKVVKVSAKSVSVETGYSWTDRVPHSKIIETRSAA